MAAAGTADFELACGLNLAVRERQFSTGPAKDPAWRGVMATPARVTRSRAREAGGASKPRHQLLQLLTVSWLR